MEAMEASMEAVEASTEAFMNSHKKTSSAGDQTYSSSCCSVISGMYMSGIIKSVKK